MQGLDATAAAVGCGGGGAAPSCAHAQPVAAASQLADPFTVIRATSQAAYQQSKAMRDRGDLNGCRPIDTANDPDNRPDVQ
jgi:hypothetical protein